MSEPQKIDTSRCMAQIEEQQRTLPSSPLEALKFIFKHRTFCQAPATHLGHLGRRLCEVHAEELRKALRNPNTLGNILAGGRARTEEEIARMVVRLQ